MLPLDPAGGITIDQAAAEAVTAAYTVHDMYAVSGGEDCFAGGCIIKHTCPIVIVGGQGTAQGDGYLPAAEAVCHLPGNMADGC